MRMQQWTPEMIRFMREAAKYGDYNRQLAEHILPHLRACDHICDAGCGLGYLSIELSDHVRHITALDKNSDAIRELNSDIERLNIRNIDAVCADLHDQCADVPFDAMIFCLFGAMQEILSCAVRLCRGKLIVLQRRSADELWPESYGRRSAMFGCSAQLTARGVPFVREEFSIPLNQPFRDIRHAREFLSMYPADRECADMTDDQILQLIRPIRHPEYRYELPVNRNLEMYVLNAKDVEP